MSQSSPSSSSSPLSLFLFKYSSSNLAFQNFLFKTSASKLPLQIFRFKASSSKLRFKYSASNIPLQKFPSKLPLQAFNFKSSTANLFRPVSVYHVQHREVDLRYTPYKSQLRPQGKSRITFLVGVANKQSKNESKP